MSEIAKIGGQLADDHNSEIGILRLIVINLKQDLSTAQARIKELESLITTGMDLETKLHNECQKNKQLEEQVKHLNELVAEKNKGLAEVAIGLVDMARKAKL